MRFNDSEDFSLGFINDEPNDDNFIEESNIVDDLASSPSFEVVEEIKVNHGLFVSTRQATETFFHQLVPSQTVKIYLNPAVVAANFSIEKVENSQRYDKKPSKTTAKENFTGRKSSAQYPWRYLSSNVVCMIVILLMHCFYLGENVENGKLTDDFMRSGSVEEEGFCPSKNVNPMKKPAGKLIIKRNDNEKEKDLLVTIRGGEGSKLGLFLKKLGLFLTISFALCTILANHAMAS
jgi:hypothetical protein